MGRRISCCVVLLFVLSACLPALADQFILTDGDLPEASISQYRVAFTRNGAVNLAKDGKWLMDAGLGYMLSEWSEWGTQIRRSSATDGWTVEGNGESLLFKGTLYDINRNPHFTFTERVTLIPGGLRFEYSVTSNDKRAIENAGIIVNMPTEVHGGSVIDFRPGLAHIELPKLLGKAVMSGSNAAMAIVSRDGPVAAFLCPSTMRWLLMDDRTWNLNTFRFIAWSQDFADKLSAGESAEFQYDLLLDELVRERAEASNVTCTIDPVGWAEVFSGQLKLRGGPASAVDGKLTFARGGTGEQAEAEAFAVKSSVENDEITLNYRVMTQRMPGENRRIVLSGVLPSGSALTDEAGQALTPGDAPVAAGKQILISWKESPKVAQQPDGTYSVSWEKTPKLLLSSDRPWSIVKEEDLTLMVLEFDDKDEVVIPIRLRSMN